MYKALSRSLKMGGSSYSELCYVVKIGWGSVWRVLIDAWKSSCSPQSIWARKKDRIRLPNCGSCVLLGVTSPDNHLINVPLLDDFFSFDHSDLRVIGPF
jgi:hypothetical protein